MKNQRGSMMISILLFSATLTMAVTMTMDYFKLNRGVQAVVLQTQAKGILTNDLETQIKISASLRQSVSLAENMHLKNCLMGVSACSHAQSFVLASPMVGNQPIAGTLVQPVAYTKLGVRCPAVEAGCENFALSYFAINGGKIDLWVKIRPELEGVPAALGPPSASFVVADFMSLKY